MSASTETAPSTTPLTRQLPGEAHPLNDQQMAIAHAVVVEGLDVVVRAKAGTGKTSTLEGVARRFLEVEKAGGPAARILYIAFNASVQKEAMRRMPRNVESRTGHSLAWAWAGERLTNKVRVSGSLTHLGPHAEREAGFLRSRPAAIAKGLGIKSSMRDLTPAAQAEIVMAVVGRYANSADRRIGAQHFVTAEGKDLAQRLSSSQEATLLAHANTYWADVCQPLGRGNAKFKTTFDHLRKMWALSNPNLRSGTYGAQPANVLFLDEGQDTPPVVAEVVNNQQMQRCVVGDPDQSIYGFLGSSDFLDESGIEDCFPLNVSYRFGPAIQDVANRFLAVLDSPDRVVGHIPGDHVGHVSHPDAVLTRTNIAMLTEIVKEQAKGRSIGVLDSTKNDLTSLVDTARAMKDETDLPSNPHEILTRFSSWDAFKTDGETSPDLQVKTAYAMLKFSGIRGLKKVVDQLIGIRDTAAAARNSRIDVMMVTAHKAKGLEWDAVRIGDDFAQPRRDKQTGDIVLPSDEDCRLAYVAVTRAKKELDPGSLGWVFDFTTRNGTATRRLG